MAGLAYELRRHRLVEELLGLCGQSLEVLDGVGIDHRFASVAASREQRAQLRRRRERSLFGDRLRGDQRVNARNEQQYGARIPHGAPPPGAAARPERRRE